MKLERNRSTDLIFGNSAVNQIERKGNNKNIRNKMKICSLEERCFSKMGSMSMEKRWRDNKNDDEPGPG